MLQKILPLGKTVGDEEKMNYATKHQTSTKSDKYSLFLNRLANSIIASLLAVSCGATLVIPMIIMTLHPSLRKSLATTSASVVIFAFAVGAGDRRNVMSLTFAYAAVLVVLVGLSADGSG